jgi:predicted ATP-grasp superfamily ATP-dependent carboligase
VKVFVYEHLTGGGYFSKSPPNIPSGSLLDEGRAMMEAVVADFVAAGFEVATQRDARLRRHEEPRVDASAVVIGSRAAERSAFARLATEADWTVVVAPEIDDELSRRVQRVEDVGGRLLGPSVNAVRRASDKWKTYQCLTENGVPTPFTWLIGDESRVYLESNDLVVRKPRWGAGSSGVRLCSPSELRRDSAGFIGQRFCPGISVSVAFLIGPNARQRLAPCHQRLSSDGEFRYLGGQLPLRDELQSRATELGKAAIGSVIDDACGYVGVDLVLGEALDGGDDYVIEVNPRLTTSYVGLRKAFRGNLAEAMVGIANGEATTLRFDDKPLQFDTHGKVRWIEDEQRHGLSCD